MKKFGIVLFSVGIMVMIYAAVDFARDRKKGSVEEVKHQNTPFPWFPTVGAVLIAGGIIMMSTTRGTKV